MLVNAIVTAGLFATLAAAFLTAGAAITRAAEMRTAQSFIEPAFQSALQTLTANVRAQAQSAQGSAPAPMPSIAPACTDPSCRYLTSETIVLAAVSPAPAASCDPSQSNCAQVQTNAYVSEGRVTARVTVTVTNAARDALVTRSRDVMLRTMNAPPYVALAGARDGAFDGTANGASTGDDGGTPAATPNPCASASTGTSDDTSIRVAYRNAASAACTDGSAWAQDSYSQQPAGAPGWSP